MSEGEANSIQVHFGRPMPLFPLHDVVVLPSVVAPLHLFEPRYLQMMKKVLDTSGQFAMATFEGDRWREEYHGRPPIRPVVCVCQVVRHERRVDGRYDALVQGVCRARIVEESPADADRLYREAVLAPVGPDDDEIDESALADHRRRIADLLGEAPLTRFVDGRGQPLSEALQEYLESDQTPTHVVIDLIGHLMLRTAPIRYSLLAEADPARRARIVIDELEHIRSLLRRAELQHDPAAPKGVHWN